MAGAPLLLVLCSLPSGPLHTLSSSFASIHRGQGAPPLRWGPPTWGPEADSPQRPWESGGVGSVLGSVLGGSGGSQGAGRAARFLFLCRPNVRQMWGPGIPPGKEAGPPGLRVWWGVGAEQRQEPRAWAGSAAPSIPHYVKPAIGISNLPFLF